MTDQTGYKNIFKSTFLFGFVTVVTIIVQVIQTKIVAILLGPEGVGTIGIFQNSANTIRSGTGLGISESAVRDVSEAHAINDRVRFSKIISITRIVVLFTAVLGIVVTAALSPCLSEWLFDSSDYVVWYILLSFTVAFRILSDGQLAILKGMRQLRNLAKATIIGSVLGLITSVPLYFIFGNNGIVPSLIVAALASYWASNHYVSKIGYTKTRLGIRQVFREASMMIKMGVALMLVTFVGLVFNLIISGYIANYGGLADVGYFQAGALVITGYFSVIITSMRTDYYPRISAIHNDNKALADEFNKQSETGLILVFPCATLFIYLSSFFINVLYSSDFAPANDYLDYAIIGTLITIVSNCLGMILLAKQAANIFLWSVVIQRLVLLAVFVLFYNLWGLKGLGLAMIYLGLQHMIVTAVILYRKYKIMMNRGVLYLLFLVIGTTLLTLYFRSMSAPVVKFGLGGAMIVFSLVYSYIYTKKRLGIDFLKSIKARIQQK